MGIFVFFSNQDKNDALCPTHIRILELSLLISETPPFNCPLFCFEASFLIFLDFDVILVMKGKSIYKDKILNWLNLRY